MLNPMVQSDLVTYRGVTILILFLQATIQNLFLEKFERYLKCEPRNSLLNYEKVKFHLSSMFIISSVSFEIFKGPLVSQMHR